MKKTPTTEPTIPATEETAQSLKSMVSVNPVWKYIAICMSKLPWEEPSPWLWACEEASADGWCIGVLIVVAAKAAVRTVAIGDDVWGLAVVKFGGKA